MSGHFYKNKRTKFFNVGMPKKMKYPCEYKVNSRRDDDTMEIMKALIIISVITISGISFYLATLNTSIKWN